MYIDDQWVQSPKPGKYWATSYSYSRSGTKCTSNKLPYLMEIFPDGSQTTIPDKKGKVKKVYAWSVYTTEDKAMQKYAKSLSEHLSLINYIIDTCITNVMNKATKSGTKGILTSLPQYTDLINTIRKHEANL